MIFDTSAYLHSMASVYLAAAALVLAFPMIMWRNYLRGKRYAFRFLFCIVTQSCFCINLVLLLGLFGICNVYSVVAGLALEYRIVIRRFPSARRATRKRARAEGAPRLRGRQRFAELVKKIRRGARLRWQAFLRLPLWPYIARHWLIVLVLAAAVVYNAAFLTHNVNIYHSYQFSDIPVHQSWIYALEHGTLFVDGIYPFGMHAMIYVLRVLTGINLREILLYFGSFQTILVLLSMYCVALKLFKNPYVSLMPIVLFSLLMNNGRYAASLPQESGMFSLLTLTYFMLDFLHSKREAHNLSADRPLRRFLRINQYFFRRYLTTNVLLIMLSVALVIEFHFYTAIAAIMMVLALAAAYLPKLIHKQYWVPLAFAGVMGAVIAVAPLGACYVSGIPFQESMAWATSVIKGETWQGSDSNYLALLEQQADEGQTESDSPDETPVDDEKPRESRSLREWLSALYYAELNFGGGSLFGRDSARLMMLCMAISAFAALIYAFFRRTRSAARDYLGIALYVALISVLGCADELGLIALVAPSRASVFIQPVLFILFAIPFDALLRPFYGLSRHGATAALTAVSVAFSAAAGYASVDLGYMHNYFDANLAYYNEPVYLLRNIKKDYPLLSYTVVSPTEEYYELLDYGYHMELSEFVHMLDYEQDVTIPSRYTFFFVEKRVLQDYYYGSVDVAESYATSEFKYMASNQDYYFQRAIIESKAYYWAQKCMEIYPNAFSVYFENDIYVVYLLEQNTFYPYDLKLDYMSGLEKQEGSD